MLKDTPVVNVFLKDLRTRNRVMDMTALVLAVTDHYKGKDAHVRVTDVKWAEDHLVACFNIVGLN